MQKGTILGIIALLTVLSYITYDKFPTQEAQAIVTQQITTKSFRFASEFQDTVLNARYQDGTELETNLTIVPQDVIIQRWDDIGIATKNNIIAQANIAGYGEVTP